MTVQPGLCRTWSETPKTVFSERGSYDTLCINSASAIHIYDIIFWADVWAENQFKCLDVTKSKWPTLYGL